MLKQRVSEGVPDFRNAVSQHFLSDDVTVIIYSGLWYTIDRASRSLSRKDVMVAYRYLVGNSSLTVDTVKATRVVLGEVQNQWYLANGLDIPPQVISNQELRLQESVMAKEATGEVAPKEPKAPRITSRSIIEQGLLAGEPDEKILAQVKKHFPDGKADVNHIRYYRHSLVRSGHLEAQPKQPREKKEKPVKTLTDAQAENAKPAKGQKASAPTKATRSTPQKVSA